MSSLINVYVNSKLRETMLISANTPTKIDAYLEDYHQVNLNTYDNLTWTNVEDKQTIRKHIYEEISKNNKEIKRLQEINFNLREQFGFRSY